METINHETHVSLEVAKLLKEAGFDWECDKSYDCTNSDCVRYEEYSAPTLDVAQRWLREVRCEYIVVHPIVNKWFYSIHRPNFGHYYRDKKFSTYEEAQEAGIKKALELILEKVE